MLLALAVAVSASHQVSAHMAGHGDGLISKIGDEIAYSTAHDADDDHGHGHDLDADTSDATCLDHDSVDHDHPVGILSLDLQRATGGPDSGILGPPLACLPAYEPSGDRPPSEVSAA
jgi:hypothetical protein